MVTEEEFMNTNYHNKGFYNIPLLNIKLDKTNYFIKDKFDSKLLYEHSKKLYEENKDKFI